MSEEKKKGFFSGVGDALAAMKSAVSETVPDEPTLPPMPVPGGAFTPPRPIAMHPVMSSVPPPMGAVPPDPNVLQKLEDKLKEALPDAYRAFSEAYETLKDTIPDEGMLFKAALKTSKTSIEKLAACFDQLLGVMSAAETDFNEKFEKTKGEILGNAQQELVNTDALIASKEAQAKALAEEIASIRAKRTSVEEQMHTDEGKLDTRKAGFQAAHAKIVARLNSQKMRVTSQQARN